MEKVILVDSDDVVIGEMEKMEAHKKAKLHRAVSVFIFNTKNQLLLQRRSLLKYHSPGLWTNTACTHPRLNETNKDAAIRRLKEEMGIVETNLKEVFYFIYKEKLDNQLTEYELDHVFVGFSDAIPSPNPNEVSEFKYIEPKTLIKDIKTMPQYYTVWFKKIIERILNIIEQN